MKTQHLNPEKTLQDFFILKKAFGFHDQTKAPNTFTFGDHSPIFVNMEGSSRESTFH